MKKRIALTALAVLTATVGSLAAAAPAFADNHFDVTVRSAASGKCLEPLGDSSANETAIVQVTCDGSPYQRWDFLDHDNSVFQIRNAVTLKCMDAAGSNVDGTPIIEWPCNGISNERFQADRALPGFVTLKSRVSGTSTHCLNVPGGQSDENLQMQILGCNGTIAQEFGVFPV